MIALLTGQIVIVTPTTVILDVAGVGYEVHVLPTLTQNTSNNSATLQLHIKTVIREDSFTMYGFVDMSEKELFVLLCSVSGIGPKLATQFLSVLSVSQLISGIKLRNVQQLSAVPGISVKKAEKILLELQPKLEKLLSSSKYLVFSANEHPKATNLQVFEDTLTALISLGYQKRIAERALAAIKVPAEESSQLLKQALRQLML